MNDPDVMSTLITTIGSIIIAAVGAIVALWQQVRSKDKVIKGYHLPVEVPQKDKRNTILLISLGGVGKTTLIKSLFNNNEANPKEATLNFDIYHHEQTPQKLGGENRPTRYQFYIADYKGQNIGDLVRAFIVQQKRPYSPLAYGYIDSLILMVDLLPPKKKKDDPEPIPQENYDEKRIQEHLMAWNDTALNAIFGLLTKEMKYVCLFINKLDLMSNQSTEQKDLYVKAFNDIAERIKKRCTSNQRFEVLLGSALAGTQVNVLEQRLMHYSNVHGDGEKT